MIRTNDTNTSPALRLDEKTAVENPLLDQLEGMGWTVQRLDMSASADATGRTSYREVVLAKDLKAALKALNPFLEPDQVDELAGRITHLPPAGLLENNRVVHDLLTTFPSVAENRQTGEVSPTVRYVDFENPRANRLRAVCQFKVAVPGTDHHIIPDIVLFVNGLPLVVIECKSPLVNEPLASAIDQLQRYSRQRGEVGEGNPELFWYSQFLIVTCRNQTKFGTITTDIEKLWYSWRDPYPVKLSELPTAGGTSPNDQQRLMAGMCRPESLLSLLQSFTVFSIDDKGRTLKIVGRYQQFRAVKKAVARLRDGLTPRARSGIIWHTQGSGKSLTMMFLVRELRRLNEFAAWKIVFITDRTQLESQLGETAASLGRTVKVAGSIAELKALLRAPAADLVMAMVHKFQEHDLDLKFPVLNESTQILTLTDEAHRSQYGLLGANLDRAIPNAARIAYTGTPIEQTETSFGDYIDKYTMRDSIKDGTTLEIVYEGRTHRAELPDRDGADKEFEDVFSENTLSERLQVLGYGSRGAYMEADATIQAKARDMVDHYVAQVFPNGFKGQVVACSREAAAKYKKALDLAVSEKVEALEASQGKLDLGTGVSLTINLDRLRMMETAVVISGGSHNDKPDLKALSDSRDHEQSIKRFKMPYGATAEAEDGTPLSGNIGLIIVNKMLLTGFDAPLEQVLYLDDVVRDHTLLQTIARVNRVADDKKEVGYIVDYVGIGNDLKRALAAYAEKEQGEILSEIRSPDDEMGKLKEAHRALWDLLGQHGLNDFSDPDAFFDLFYDEDIRFTYILAFKALTQAFNVVLPRKEALDYLSDYQGFVKINELASRHLHDKRLSMRGIPDKLRAITDAFLVSEGIEIKVAPISILDDDFQKGVDTHTRTRTKAAEVEHAIRSHLSVVAPEDPELAASFADELRGLLRRFADNWDEVYTALEELRRRISVKEKEQTYGLDRRRRMPLFRIYHREIFGDASLSNEEIAALVNLTQLSGEVLSRELLSVGFWRSTPAQAKLKVELQDLFLEPHDSLPSLFSRREALIARTLEWARENNSLLTEE